MSFRDNSQPEESGSSQIDSHQKRAWNIFPSASKPERVGAAIIFRDQDERADNARVAQLRDAFSHQKLSNSPPLISWSYREMINQAPASVVPAEDRAHYLAIFFRNPA